MSEINAPATLTTSGGTIDFNPYMAATSYYWFTAVTGLDQAPLRTASDAKPQADGIIIYDSLRDARRITLEGLVVGTDISDRNDLCDDLIEALESIVATDGTYTWTPTGGSLKTLTVRSDMPVIYSGGLGFAPKVFTFGLVAANPAIT